MQTESEFIEKLVPTFGRYFKISKEVWSKCKTARIDLVLNLDDKYFFGVECKTPDAKKGEEIGRYVNQAIRYSKLEFEVSQNVFKKIPIFICPPLSYKYFLMNESEVLIDGKKYHKDRHNEFNSHHSFNGFLGSLNIGEIRKNWDGSFYLSLSNSTIFSSYKDDKGLNLKNYINLVKKIGL